MKIFLAVMAAAAFQVRLMPQPDGPLEPSIQNEVDHAVDLAEAWLARQTNQMATAVSVSNGFDVARLFATNGLTREKIALRLVSSQKGGGWWIVSTNAAPTRAVIEILKGL
jgi:hypothetical protein